MKALLFAAIFLALMPAALAQRQLEKLGRGVIVMRTGTTSAYVGWRLLGTDPADTKFNLYRVTSALDGPGGWVERQGFYVYRGDRLVFRLI